MITKAIIGGAFGAAAAVLTDLHEWSGSEKPYNWKLAARRWVYGAAAGLAGAVGVGVV